MNSPGSLLVAPLATRPSSVVLIIILSILSNQVYCSQEQEVQCIMNMYKLLTCTWDSTRENYTLYYRHGTKSDNVKQCPQYLVVNTINIGCKISVSDSYTIFTVMLNSSSHSIPIRKTFQKLQDYVKMDPPFNLIPKSTNSLELLLTWNQTRGSIPGHCISYEVKHRNKDNDKWMVKKATSTLFSLPSFDCCQNYTFHVRSQVNSLCANSEMWSEWSEGVTWARNTTVCEEQPSTKMHPSITIVMVLLLLLVISLAVIRQERIWIILVPRIPNPGKKFEDLFSNHKGDFQAWLGVSKKAVENMKLSYTEPLCTVSEDPECPGPDGKTLASSSPANEQP